jgi:hypothetical protein
MITKPETFEKYADRAAAARRQDLYDALPGVYSPIAGQAEALVAIRHGRIREP